MDEENCENFELLSNSFEQLGKRLLRKRYVPPYGKKIKFHIFKIFDSIKGLNREKVFKTLVIHIINSIYFILF
jgi:hypothetical protein